MSTCFAKPLTITTVGHVDFSPEHFSIQMLLTSKPSASGCLLHSTIYPTLISNRLISSFLFFRIAVCFFLTAKLVMKTFLCSLRCYFRSWISIFYQLLKLSTFHQPFTDRFQ
eukprot:NODE_179_length_15798_cov_0.379769.p10 type:complete len:112 gc:universal NODE_179_length_15798_cov_0.379769:3822-4157(+)